MSSMSPASSFSHQPVAIVGIGCRLPGAVDSPDQFWALLSEGREAISEVPADRWDLSRHFHPDPANPLTQHVARGGFIDDIDQFDAAFFGITPREAICIDPQQRLMLEVGWRAIEDSGLRSDTLRGRSVGVFIGISSSDYSSLLWASSERYATPDNEPFVLPGNTGCIAANRLSYFFDFKGPSFTVDTACSSSLVAVHLACESIWRGESELALVGGVQALIHPGIQASFCKAGLLSPDGRCKSFDASADGYVRSEGAGAVLLKPLAAAQADGDTIYAVIHGSAVNSDGRSNGMAAPNARAQMACIRAAFASAGIAPSAAQYVEAHGTGTRQGDPIELRALGTILGEGRDHSSPCRIGSVKTNLGHSETAAGITGLIKAALSIYHRQLPPSLHFTVPNPAVDFDNLMLKVQTRLEPFPQPDAPAVVGVSSFGFGGTNAHVVLADAPVQVSLTRLSQQLPLQPLCLSARTPEALRDLADVYLRHLSATSQLQLSNLTASANTSRSHFRIRAVCLASDLSSLKQRLACLAKGEPMSGLVQGQMQSRRGAHAWLFTGQGSQSLGMAQELLAHQPIFRRAIEDVADLLDPLMQVSLVDFLRPPSGREEELFTKLAQTAFTQPVLFAVGYALAELWTSWGLKPDLLLGHSVGEIVAAHRAGVFDLSDACRLIAARGRLMQQLPASGGMVAVLAPAERIQDLLGSSQSLAVAALNGPDNTVISGHRNDLEEFVRSAEAAGIICHPLEVSHAFHSPSMEPMLGSFESELHQLRFKLPKLPLVSTLTGSLAGPEIATPGYWCDHVVSPVCFAKGLRTLLDQGAKTFLEVGAKPTLITMARHQISERDQQQAGLHFLPSLVPGRSDLSVILSSLAEFYCSGETVDWHGFHSPFQYRRQKLPGYPFQRNHYWWSSPEFSPAPATVWTDFLGTSNTQSTQVHPKSVSSALTRLHLPGPERRYELTLSALFQSDLVDHCIRGQVVYPAAGFLEQAIKVLREEGAPQHVRMFRLDQPLRLLADGTPHQLQLVWNPAEQSLKFYSSSTVEGDWIEHGCMSTDLSSCSTLPWLPEPRFDSAEIVKLTPFYDTLASFGLEYGPSYRQLTGLWRVPNRAWADLERQHESDDRCLLDSCFQAVAAALDPSFLAGCVLLPLGLEFFEQRVPTLPNHFSCEIRVLPSDDLAFVQADLVLHDSGSILGWIKSFRLRRIPLQALKWMFPNDEPSSLVAGPEQWLFESRLYPIQPDELSSLSEARAPRRAILLGGLHVDDKAGLSRWCADVGAHLHVNPQILPDSDVFTQTDAIFIWHDLEAEDATLTNLCSSLLSLAQSFSSAKAPERVILVLQGGRTARHRALVGGLRGWWKTAALEQPRVNWTLLEILSDSGDQPAPDDWSRIWSLSESQASLAWRNGRLCHYQLEPLSTERYRWATESSGSLDSFVRQPLTEQPLVAGEIELAVETIGLNFRDVLNALGLLETYGSQLGLQDSCQIPFGGECVGRVVAVGPGVSSQRIGERVIAALAVGSLASHVRCRAQFCIPLPSSLSPQIAASVSTAFLTAIYGLETLAQLKPGETVLIHSAAGGVGQAALQVAHRCGAKVFATASQPKQAALLTQGVEAVFDSRNTDFADEILLLTEGRGVDVVLNSLKGEWVDASFHCLAQGGRFVELGKIEIWSRQQVAERRPDARYLPFDLLEVGSAQPALLRQLFDALIADLQAERFSPIPIQTFAESQLSEAFRLMAQARHVGKLVISRGEQPTPIQIRSDATYLVSGGLGAIGHRLLAWLVERGARSLLVVSRSADRPPPRFLHQLNVWREQGITCQLVAAALGSVDRSQDVVSALVGSFQNLPAGRPLRGLFHAAGVLDDGLLEGQTPSRLQSVLAPKLEGWLQLEQAVAQTSVPLEFAVAFSSMASLLGSPGQSNYSAANGSLDGACSEGYGFAGTDAVTLSVQWGPWDEIGMAAGHGRRLQSLGIGLLSPDQAFDALGLLLKRGTGGVVAVLNNDWGQLRSQAPPRHVTPVVPLLAGLSSQTDPQAGSQRVQLMALPESERGPALLLMLQRRLADVMGLESPSSLEPSDSLFQIGLDSLMAVELAAGIHHDFGVKLELESLAGDPSLEALAAIVLRGLGGQLAYSCDNPLDLAREAQLPAGWHIGSPEIQDPSPGPSILLTGGSGFLGAYLLAGQLNRWPDLQVKVLVRASDCAAGLARITQNLDLYGLWQEPWLKRIQPIVGDLALPRFGLTECEFHALAGQIGGILHNGAQLSQMAPYSQLASANVGGTRTVLDLAALHRPLPVELISSVAVYEARAYRNCELLETDDLSEWEGIHIGYSQTKWVSERLVLAAGRLGLPVRIYRPPLIAGHSVSGLWHQDDLLHRLLRGCLELGLAPDIPWELDLVPVDYVADAVSVMAWQPAESGRCFHLHNPQSLLLADVLLGLIQRGAPLRMVSMPVWLDALEQQPANPLHPIRAFFSRRWGEDHLTYPEMNQAGVRARPSCEITVAALAERGVRCPNFEQLIGPYARTFLGSIALG